MSEQTLHLALVGRNIQASQSPAVYRKLHGPNVDYHLLDYQSVQLIPTLTELFTNYHLDGLSITSPYKQHFLPAVHADEVVLKTQALNCIRCGNGEFFATNTDYLALSELYPQMVMRLKSAEFVVCVLGDGVMASLVLNYLHAQAPAQVSRQLARRLNNLDVNTKIEDRVPLLIINCCTRQFQFSGEIDAPDFLFWDLNYNATHAPALITNPRYVDGREFLLVQAKYALNFWGF